MMMKTVMMIPRMSLTGMRMRMMRSPRLEVTTLTSVHQDVIRYKDQLVHLSSAIKIRINQNVRRRKIRRIKSGLKH